MIRTPLFGKDSIPHHTSAFIALLGTLLFWLILLIAGIFIPAGKTKPKLKTVQIVLASPEKTFEKTDSDSNLKKETEAAMPAEQPLMQENQESVQMPAEPEILPPEPVMETQNVAVTPIEIPEPKPAPVAKKTEVQEKQTVKPKKTEPAPVKKTEPKIEQKPKAEPKKVEKKAEPVQPVEEPVLVKSTEELWAELQASKKNKEPVDFSKIFGDSESSADSSFEQTDVPRKVAAKNEIEGAAGKVASKSATTPVQSESTSSKTVENTNHSDSKTSDALSKIQNTNAASKIETASQGKSLDSIKTAGSGKIDIKFSDEKSRKLIEPATASITISPENAREITTSVTVTISFYIQPNGNVTNITFEPASSLPVPVRNEIKSQLVFWRFDAAEYEVQAKFEYTIVKR